MSAHILLVEDDPTLGELLETELIRAGYSCSWSQDGTGGLAHFEAKEPDLVLLDLMLPDQSGFSVLSKIRESSQVPVIVLTAHNMSEDKVQGLDLGADDYVTKPFWNDELLARIRARLRRPTAAKEDARHSFGAVEIDLDARTVVVAGAEARLTPTEFELLEYLVMRLGRAVRREQLVSAVLRGDEATEQALQTHISRLRRKLKADGGRIRTVWGIGYRLDEE